MIETLLNGGPFMLVLLILFGSVVFISLKNIKEPYNTNAIVLLGIFSAVFGIFATYLGINSASNAVANISNISPQILISGLKTSLITSFNIYSFNNILPEIDNQKLDMLILHLFSIIFFK